MIELVLSTPEELKITKFADLACIGFALMEGMTPEELVARRGRVGLIHELGAHAAKALELPNPDDQTYSVPLDMEQTRMIAGALKDLMSATVDDGQFRVLPNTPVYSADARDLLDRNPSLREL